MSILLHGDNSYVVSNTEANRLILFTEVIAVSFEIDADHVSTLCGQNTACFEFKADCVFIVIKRVLFIVTIACSVSLISQLICPFNLQEPLLERLLLLL